MSDTPLTDRATIVVEFEGDPLFKSITYVTVEFAQGLERELAASKFRCAEFVEANAQLAVELSNFKEV